MLSTRSDWPLQRKGPVDQARHQEKIREAIQQNLRDLITEESIIRSDGKAIIRVPIRSMKEYHFRFNPYKGKQVGQGDGDTPVGEVLGKQKSEAGQGKKGQAGQDPGVDYYEAEVDVDDLAELLFANLSLPHLERKESESLEAVGIKFREVRRKGIFANLDKRRTILENIKRNARQGDPTFKDLKDDDLRFRSWAERYERHHNAVIIAMRDVSGSMGEFKKWMSRTLFFWMVRFLRTKYDNLQLVFITHHIEAKEVDEETFFQLGESGGTRVSSAYELALQVMEERYPPVHWNTYLFHFTDGDNWGDADNRRCVDLVRRMLEVANLFGYGEINDGGYMSPLSAALSTVEHPRLVRVNITKREDVYPALQAFFPPEEVKNLA